MTPQGHGSMTPQPQGQYYRHPGGGSGGIYEEGSSQYIDEASVSLKLHLNDSQIEVDLKQPLHAFFEWTWFSFTFLVYMSENGSL